jgi:hypothetical protein
MENPVNLEELLNKDWKKIDEIADCYILAKGEDRLIYCTDEEKVIAQYQFK